MWTHKKHKKKHFKGTYRVMDAWYPLEGQVGAPIKERVFMLIEFPDVSFGKVVSFESWQAAKKAGWIKV